jgi:hypothetical protein
MAERISRNVIVTGIPRSGTTLTAALIDGLPNAVCLNEPQWQVGRRFSDPVDYAKWLAGDFIQLRQKLLSGEPVQDRRSLEGAAPVTNYFSRQPGSGEVKNNFRLADFSRPGLSSDFTLAVKHNGPYLAILKAIIDLRWFNIIAVVRHPVEVIASWRSLDLPISRGEMPGAAPYWPRLHELTAQPMDLLEKQVKIYDLMCRRIYNLREYMHILPYEELLAQPTLLSKYLKLKGDPAAGLIEKPKGKIAADERQEIADAVKTHGEFYRRFYPGI